MYGARNADGQSKTKYCLVDTGNIISYLFTPHSSNATPKNKVCVFVLSEVIFRYQIPPPPLSKARLGAKMLKKQRSDPGGGVRLGHHFSFILPINRKRRCKKNGGQSGVGYFFPFLSNHQSASISNHQLKIANDQQGWGV